MQTSSEAILPSGGYRVEGSRVTVHLALSRDGVKLAADVEVTGSKNDLAALVEAIDAKLEP